MKKQNDKQSLKKLAAETDRILGDYIKKMEAIRKEAVGLLLKAEAEKIAQVKDKIAKIKV